MNSQKGNKSEKAMEYHLLLSRREREIAALVALGMSNKEIAKQLGIRHQRLGIRSCMSFGKRAHASVRS